MTSYLSENEAENLLNGDSNLPEFLTSKWNISRTIWRIEVGDGSFFGIFRARSFECNFIFDRSFPLINSADFLTPKIESIPSGKLNFHENLYFLYTIGIIYRYRMQNW